MFQLISFSSHLMKLNTSTKNQPRRKEFPKCKSRSLLIIRDTRNFTVGNRIYARDCPKFPRIPYQIVHSSNGERMEISLKFLRWKFHGYKERGAGMYSCSANWRKEAAAAVSAWATRNPWSRSRGAAWTARRHRAPEVAAAAAAAAVSSLIWILNRH